MNAAKQFGADATIHGSEDVPARLKEFNGGRPGRPGDRLHRSDAGDSAGDEIVDRGGTLLFFAPTAAGVDVPIPLFDYWRDEITVVTSYAGSGDDLKESLELIRDHKVRVADMVTHRLPLAETGVGFQLTASGQDSIKVIIDPLL